MFGCIICSRYTFSVMRFLGFVLVPVVTVLGWVPSEQQVAALAKAEIDTSELKRLFVISDVHGDFYTLVGSLYLALKEANGLSEHPVRLPSSSDLITIFLLALTDDKFLQTRRGEFPLLRDGSGFHLVQMGDLIDKGEFSHRCLETMRLVTQVIGFEVTQLVGNHELFAVVYPGYMAQHAGQIHENDDLPRDESVVGFHSGYLWNYIQEHMRVMARVGDTLFVHGGISWDFMHAMMPIREDLEDPENPWRNFNTYNRLFMEYMDMDDEEKSKELLGDLFLSDDSMLMTRDMAGDSGSVNCRLFAKILARFGADQIIVGHTPQWATRKIKLICDGLIVLTDTLMSSNAEETLQGIATVLIMDFDQGKLQRVHAVYKELAVIQEQDATDDNVSAETNDSTTGVSTVSETIPITKPLTKTLPIIENDSSHSRSRLNPPSAPLRTIRKQFRLKENATDIVYSNTGVVAITKGELGPSKGLVATLKLQDIDMIDAIRKLVSVQKKKPNDGVPQITEITPQRLLESLPVGQTKFFLKAAGTTMARDFSSDEAKNQILDIKRYLETLGICYREDRQDRATLYATDAEKNQLELVNLSVLILCPRRLAGGKQ